MMRALLAAVVIAATSSASDAQIASPNAQDSSVVTWLDAEAANTDWSSGDAPLSAVSGASLTGLEGAVFDSAVAPVQFPSSIAQSRTVRRQPVGINAPAARPAVRGAAIGGLASIPYMIGDTGAGTCMGFQGLLQAKLAHPTLACGRLNISEANSPLPADRVYYSYRHFANSTRISAYQFSDTLDLDQHMVAWENAFWDRTGSLELRVPVEQRLRSDIFSIIAPDFGVVDPLVAPADGRQAELGNIALVFKMLLWERPSYALTGGVGVTLPTARDVNYQVAVSGEINFAGLPNITADKSAAFQSVFANETVYISPFLAWVVAPPARWFHQGFLQVEVAANPSHVTVFGDGATDFFDQGAFVGFYDYFTPTPVRTELHAQPLMRLNLGWGYILAEQQTQRRSSGLAALFELHYTTTLADANLSNVPLATLASGGTVPLQTITIGNGLNRVDLLNAATGLSAHWGPWIVTNGVIAPIRPLPDRGFDFEYNLQVQRLF